MRALSDIIVAVAVAFAFAAAAADVTPRERGSQAWVRGDFDAAAEAWTAEAEAASREGAPRAQAEALSRAALALEAAGRLDEARTTATSAVEVADASGNERARASARRALAQAQLASGEQELAAASFKEATALAAAAGDDALAAAILNNTARMAWGSGDASAALDQYARSETLARRAGEHELVARAAANWLQVALESGGAPDAEATAARLAQTAAELPPSSAKAQLLIRSGAAQHALANKGRGSLKAAVQSFQAAAAIADQVGDDRARSSALGEMARLYAERGRVDEALELTRRAIYAAQQASAPVLVYRWQWLAGRLQRERGEVDEAIAAYRSAVEILNRLRGGPTFTSTVPYDDAVEPVYMELVDLLIERSVATRNEDARQRLLREARDQLEALRVVELQDYFRDSCVAQTRPTAPDAIPGAVVIYPVMLEDRTELIVSIGGGLRSVRVDVGRDTLRREIAQLRGLLEKRTTFEFRPHAEQLYEWLIRPLEPLLEGASIDALVFVPADDLRLIPMAALYDARTDQYLIEKHPVAITPGLTLTEPTPIDRSDVALLAAGLTESVQGYPALPAVASELDAIHRAFPGRELRDEHFVEASLEEEIQERAFSMVHIASHAEFGSEPEDSFVLTYDGRISMSRLGELVRTSQYHERPIELLTLSACSTASGDRRSALGLAGVAVRAGARSALATLWYVSDQAAAELVSSFYSDLATPETSRAAALQQAQLELLRSKRWRHPGYWSPFLLINSWL